MVRTVQYNRPIYLFKKKLNCAPFFFLYMTQTLLASNVFKSAAATLRIPYFIKRKHWLASFIYDLDFERLSSRNMNFISQEKLNFWYPSLESRTLKRSNFLALAVKGLKKSLRFLFCCFLQHSIVLIINSCLNKKEQQVV